MVYEHRDEPPEAWNTWNGKKIPRYRRCYAGIVRNGLPLLNDRNSSEFSNEIIVDYKMEFAESIRELSNIAYDINGDDAKRILRNILRWISQKQEELNNF